jgi:predicted nucleotidyltransferase
MPSVTPKRPVDPITVRVLGEVNAVVQRYATDFMLVGATARDVLLQNVYGLPPSRQTRDIDLAIVLPGWDSFDALRKDLIATQRFKADSQIQRLRYCLPDGSLHPVDLLPFGDIEHDAGSIAWPPDMTVVMNVLGFADALRAAVRVQMTPELEVPVASLAGIALLKVIAWSDRGSDNPKDAVDLAEILERYADAGNQERIYGEAAAALESLQYDPQRAGMWLLGRDLARLTSDATRDTVIGVLREPRQRDRLATHMIRGQPVDDNAYEAARTSLADFCAGILGET